MQGLADCGRLVSSVFRLEFDLQMLSPMQDADGRWALASDRPRSDWLTGKAPDAASAERFSGAGAVFNLGHAEQRRTVYLRKGPLAPPVQKEPRISLPNKQ